MTIIDELRAAYDGFYRLHGVAPSSFAVSNRKMREFAEYVGSAVDVAAGPVLFCDVPLVSAPREVFPEIVALSFFLSIQEGRLLQQQLASAIAERDCFALDLARLRATPGGDDGKRVPPVSVEEAFAVLKAAGWESRVVWASNKGAV